MNEKLRKLQLTQLEMLKLIDDICKTNDIKYSLYAGTLLGAVRHKGFIPWDDDLDICMERSEYERFIKIWDTVQPKGYILQNKENSPNFSQSFTKIRKEHTTFLQSEQERGKYHTGIFVDIFPLDREPDGKLRQVIFKFKCMIYQLYTREFIPERENALIKLGSKILLLITPVQLRRKLRKKLICSITKNNNDRKKNIIGIDTMASLKVRYPADMFDDFTELLFEGEKFPCCLQWDENLKCTYGDYWELPPENEQNWKHHPIVLDFENDCEELMD